MLRRILTSLQNFNDPDGPAPPGVTDIYRSRVARSAGAGRDAMLRPLHRVMPESLPALQPAQAANQLRVASRTEADEATLILSGEIDFASAPTLEAELHDAENSLPGRIVLDLAALDFIDSTGIHVLAHAQQRADAAARGLVLTHVPPHAQRLFSLTGIDARVAIRVGCASRGTEPVNAWSIAATGRCHGDPPGSERRA